MAFTFFFRDYQILDLAVNHTIEFAAGRSKLTVWDAGCAMGPEPFSLAIMFAERMGRFAFKNLHIDATDIDVSNLFGDIIARGVFPEQELKRIPPEIFGKYFRPSGNDGHFELDYSVRSRVAFQRHDLLRLEPAGSGYSLILCKNVLLHFSPEERIRVMRMFHEALVPGGFFATEQTQKIPEELSHLFERVSPDAQLFRRKAA